MRPTPLPLGTEARRGWGLGRDHLLSHRSPVMEDGAATGLRTWRFVTAFDQQIPDESVARESLGWKTMSGEVERLG